MTEYASLKKKMHPLPLQPCILAKHVMLKRMYSNVSFAFYIPSFVPSVLLFINFSFGVDE